MKRIERVEELFLRALLARQELDVVEEKHVGRPVTALELERRGVLDGVDHLVHEFLGAHEEDPSAGPDGTDVVPDGVHEVGLAQPHAPVQKERVVARAGLLRHRHSRGVSQLVPAPHDERLECVVGVKDAFVPAGQRPARPLLEHGRFHRAHLEGEDHRVSRHGGEGGLDQPSVVVIEPIDVELARDLEHHRRPIGVERPERTEPGFERLARDMGLDLLERPLPHITRHHGFRHRCHVIPIPAQCVHRLSTQLSTNEPGRNGHHPDPLRPGNGLSALSFLTTGLVRFERARVPREGDRTARTRSVNGSRLRSEPSRRAQCSIGGSNARNENLSIFEPPCYEALSD